MPRRKQDSLRIEQGIRPAASPVSGYSAPRLPRRRTDRLEILSVLSRSLSGFLAGKERQQEEGLAQEGNTAGASAYNDTAAALDAASQEALQGNKGAFNKLISQGVIPALGSPYAQQNFDRKVAGGMLRQLQHHAEQSLVEWTQVDPAQGGGEAQNVAQQMAAARQQMLEDNPLLAQSEEARQAFEEGFAALTADVQDRGNKMIVTRKDELWREETSDSYQAIINGAVGAVQSGDLESFSARMATVVGNVEDDHSDGMKDSRKLYVGAIEGTIEQLIADDDHETAGIILDNARAVQIGPEVLGEDAAFTKLFGQLEKRINDGEDTETDRLNKENDGLRKKAMDEFGSTVIPELISQRGSQHDINTFIESKTRELADAGNPYLGDMVQEMERWRGTLSQERPDDLDTVRSISRLVDSGDLVKAREALSIAQDNGLLSGSTAESLDTDIKGGGSEEKFRKGFTPWVTIQETVDAVSIKGIHPDAQDPYLKHRFALQQEASQLWSQAIAETQGQDGQEGLLRIRANEIAADVQAKNDAFLAPIREAGQKARAEIEDLLLRHQDPSQVISKALTSGAISNEEAVGYGARVPQAVNLERWTSSNGLYHAGRASLKKALEGDFEYQSLQEDDPQLADATLEAVYTEFEEAHSAMVKEVFGTVDPAAVDSEIIKRRKALIKDHRTDITGEQATAAAEATALEGADSEDALAKRASREVRQIRIEEMSRVQAFEKENPGKPFVAVAPEILQDRRRNSLVGYRGLDFHRDLNEYRSGDLSHTRGSLEVSRYRLLSDAIVDVDGIAGERSEEVREAILDSRKVMGMTPEQIIAGKVYIQQPIIEGAGQFLHKDLGDISADFDPKTEFNPFTDFIWSSTTQMELDIKQRPEMLEKLWSSMDVAPSDIKNILFRQREMLKNNTPKR